jgi:isoaspartyl peptidase/L-asparaginase-like protein (Ntn-hydrolase superfamily)
VGALAAATSTGGLSGKLPGRVGDSPLVGAGTWADQDLALSATGDGECFMRCAFAHQVAMLSRFGRDLPEALTAGLDEVRDLHGEGGCIVIRQDGACALAFITDAMPRGYASPAERWIAIGHERASQ